MLKVRVIPCLLLKNKGLVKTIKFSQETYIGDPINAVRIFNEKEADELIFLDIEATREKRPPDFKTIYNIASECFMPLCYGGGIKNISEIKRIFKLGVEKIALNTSAFEKPGLVKKAAELFGSQAIVISIDVKKDLKSCYRLFIRGGTLNTGKDPISYAREMEKLGAGELLINNIDRDGTMIGYDFKLLKPIVEAVNIPVIACGGAGKLTDFKEVVDKAQVSAVAAGSLFVYCGRTHGILINYPSYWELEKLFSKL